ncbi:hypothetical protein MNEG_2024 [Monoraphidium neglectum]|uniref:Uncharacterized protein n=1 Tax=Monoraphidium neglectum TaxID=145388 RepID=A0A0D2N047_9CHLO|nr:hypothetical protein MNEG_2024 [Monoraphidium neglectum]KIZ05932.1 hypothetical protein MNEG_2024 [Monoraphidium neglectum]|eukprot:XP_013904951.1 hypothetical protein MNEG_2024 [Monoraphidium neglectum]
MAAAVAGVLRATAEYYGALLYCLATRCNIEGCPLLQHDTAALVHVYSLAKTLQLWAVPHYRAPTFGADMRANLRNVAIPGTGVPLSWFCASWWLALLFMLVVNPIACLLGAVYAAEGGSARGSWLGKVAGRYRGLLLAPSHWFATWRLNCVLVAWHAAVGGSARDYALEDKAPFLLEADRLGLPVAPFVKAPRVFVKHRSIEGGQGIHVFDNFTAGGDWIVSEALDNAPCLARMLPRGAPLSTFRVVTASVVWLEDREAQRQGATALTSAALAAAAVAAGAGPQAAAAPAAPGGKAQGAAGPGGHVPTGGDSGRRHGQLAKLQLSPLPQDIHTPPPWRRSPSPSPGARRIVSRSPSPGIRSLLAGRRSRASRSPPLPVSTSVQQAGGTPRLLNSDDGSGGAGWHSPTGRSGATSSSSSAMYERSIEVLTSVFRAGLAGAKTDHVSICFPVDDAGELGCGVTANHWYNLGWRHVMRIPASASATWEEHPQSGHLVAGQVIPDWWASVASLALQAHALLAPAVPLIGWDVALPAEGEPCLLEMNISANNFNGAYDREGYADLLCSFFAELGRAEEEQRLAGRAG